MMGKTTETADLSKWELTDSGLTAGEPTWDQTRPCECGYAIWFDLLGGDRKRLAVRPALILSA